MERLMHETRETFSTLTIFLCLAAGISGAVFYTMLDPNMATLAALTAAIGMLALAKRLLDRSINSPLNSLLVGAVGLGGFVLLLQGVRTVLS